MEDEDFSSVANRAKFELTANLGHIGIIATLLGLIWSSGVKLAHIDDTQANQSAQLADLSDREKTDAAAISGLTSAQAVSQAGETAALSALNGQIAQLSQELDAVLQNRSESPEAQAYTLSGLEPQNKRPLFVGSLKFSKGLFTSRDQPDAIKIGLGEVVKGPDGRGKETDAPAS